jgi:hypothetical protein
MSQACYLARASNVAARMIGDEMMIMSGLDSSLYSLNETASVLWQAADGVTPLSQIVQDHICVQFEIDADTAMRDATEVAQQLAHEGILLLSESPIARSGPSSKESP